jgi:hypothetical protein
VAKRKRARPPSLRERIRSVSGGCCEYCRLPQNHDPLPFHIEHVIAKKHRGPTRFENLALACAACNLFKASNIAGLDPTSRKLTRLFHPRVDDWNDHFEWEGPLLVGLTAIGRTTVEVLNINAHERVSLRRLLIRLDEFP